MNVGIYGRPSFRPMEVLGQGFEALGHTVKFRRSEVFTPDQTEAFDFVAVYGLQGQASAVRTAYDARGIPCLVADVLHFRSGPPQFRYSLGDHHWLPPGRCPTDRLAALELDFSRLPQGANVLICGQKAGDSAHGMAERELTGWAQKVVNEARAATTRKIVWRPHPQQPSIAPEGAFLVSPERPLSEDLKDAWVVVTYNSTAGLEALQSGLPVIALGPALYSSIAYLSIDAADRVEPPSAKAVSELFSRIAYTQWEAGEVADGTAIKFYLSCLAGRVDKVVTAAESKPAKPEAPAAPKVIVAKKPVGREWKLKMAPEMYLKRWPDGQFADLAREVLSAAHGADG